MGAILHAPHARDKGLPTSRPPLFLRTPSDPWRGAASDPTPSHHRTPPGAVRGTAAHIAARAREHITHAETSSRGGGTPSPPHAPEPQHGNAYEPKHSNQPSTTTSHTALPAASD